MNAALPARNTMSIGEVLAELRPDYPEVTISKIRFLETEGLVEPQRAPSGYRRFSHDDVARLRYVLTVQATSYLPLKVIKEQLQTLDRGAELMAEEPLEDDVPRAVVVEDAVVDAADVRLSRETLVDAAAITGEMLDELEEHGLLTRRGTSYDAAALRVAQTARQLAAFGLEPRHLRTVKGAAERELALIEQVVAPRLRQRDAAARGRAEDASTEIARLSARLHAIYVESGLRRLRG